MVDVVVLNYNDAEQTCRYVSLIKEFDIIDHIVIVDNHSSDFSIEYLKTIEDDKVKIIQSGKNGGYGYGNNFGIKYLIKNYCSPYIAITNPDVIFEEKCLIKCVDFLYEHQSQNYAVVAPRMKELKDGFNKNGWLLPGWLDYICFDLFLLGKIFRLTYVDTCGKSYSDCDCVAGSMLVINSSMFLDAGMFDENIFLYCEETALGFRLKDKGYKTALLTNQEFIHEHSVSINKTISSKLKQYKLIWKSRMYILDTYYELNGIKRLMSKIIKDVASLEMLVKVKIK